MSKAAKLSLFILIALLLVVFGFAVFSVLGKQAVERQLKSKTTELSVVQDDFAKREKKYIQDAKSLGETVNRVNGEKAQLNREIKRIEKETEKQIQELTTQIDEISGDREKWKRRLNTIREERDKLLVKIDDLTKKLKEKPKPQIVYKEKEPEPKPEPEPAKPEPAKPVVTAEAIPPSTDERGGDEEYWAGVLKQKASLEVDIQKLKDELSAKSISIVELRQNNENLQLEVDKIRAEKEEIAVEIRHKTDMLDNISLELARTKNDKKFISDRAAKLNTENGELRVQMKQLVSVKNALEKSIVRLGQEKEKMEGKLGKTETLIQSKIDAILEIKDDLDRSIRSAQTDASPSQVELPPIVVSSNGDTQKNSVPTPTGFNGRVISINEPNNFVIVNIGENSGIHLGDSLSVYRDSKYIARLEVIQVRKDISAADLKDQWTKVRVGDIIR